MLSFELCLPPLVSRRVIKLFGTTRHKVSGGSGISFGSIFAWGIHAMSFFLSNSKLEAKLGTFLLTTAVLIKFKHSIVKA
ncbi:hypothetical protein MLD38_035915 [Melastoma candidum]|uniref:Uncharacterized protein n=1 Tax=Melastoma candidum TaxID=119954 RepID=A0ACB9LI22_9MYRT|nr:hypothetical protein MLD38_035915 [Melastoma candidum]